MSKQIEVHVHRDHGAPHYERMHELVLDGRRTHWVKQWMRDGSIRYLKVGISDDGAEWERLAKRASQ